MNILRIILNNTRYTLLILVATVPLVACAEMNKKHGDGDSTSPEPGNKISDFQFSVTTDKDGGLRPVVTRKDGTKLTGEQIPRNSSIKASSIEEIETMTIIRAKGSHFLIVVIAGVPMRFDFAHP